MHHSASLRHRPLIDVADGFQEGFRSADIAQNRHLECRNAVREEGNAYGSVTTFWWGDVIEDVGHVVPLHPSNVEKARQE